MTAEDDPGMQALVGRRHAVGARSSARRGTFTCTEVLRVSLEENLEMIGDSVQFLGDAGPRSDLRRRTFL